MFVIKEYPMVCVNFDNLASSFQIFMVSKSRCYVSNLGLSFIDAIVKAINKVVERKMSLIKL